MNMVRFHKDVWVLHRKLHHRFLKFARFITSATKDLPDYQKRDGRMVVHTYPHLNATGENVVKRRTICLLSSDSEEGSTTLSDC